MAKRPTQFRGAVLVRAGAGNTKPLEILSAAGVSIFSVDEDGNLTIAGIETAAAEVENDILVLTDKKIQFRDTGIFLQSGADGKLTISADGTGGDDITLAGSVTVSQPLTATLGMQAAAVARTATAAGDGTGVVAAGTSFVSVTSANADHIITLPAPVVGNIIWLYVGANGFELRSSTPASIAINGGTGANAESAIPASSLVRCVCVSATAWIANFFDADGDEAKVEAAA